MGEFRRRLLRIAIAATAVVFAAATVAAQSPAVPRGASEREIIASAEAEGAAHPRLASAASVAPAARTCVEGDEMGPAHSGEFSIGGQLGGAHAMLAGREGKIWWAPLHRAATMPPLVVRGRSLTSPTDTVRYTTSRIAWPLPRAGEPVPEGERQYFFPSGITIPRPGRWLLVATSGANWGCFMLTVVSRSRLPLEILPR